MMTHELNDEDGASVPPSADILIFRVVPCAACNCVWCGSDLGEGIRYNDSRLSGSLEQGDIR